MLGDDIIGALPELRAQALSMMVDTCEIREPDSWVGETCAPGAVAWTYQGSTAIPCRVKKAGGDMSAGTSSAGNQDLTLTRVKISLPIDIDPLPGQVITITAAADATLTERRFVVDPAGEPGSLLTARRVVCHENLG